MGFIIKKQQKLTDNHTIKIYVNKRKNRITFKIKTGYNLKLLTFETVKLLGIIKSKIIKDKENVPHLEITEVVLVHYNIVNNDYPPVLYTFVPNKSFGQLLDISAKNLIFLETFNSEVLYI